MHVMGWERENFQDCDLQRPLFSTKLMSELNARVFTGMRQPNAASSATLLPSSSSHSPVTRLVPFASFECGQILQEAQLTQGFSATAPSFQDGRQPPSWILSNRK